MTSVVFFVRMRALKTRDARTLTRRGFTEMAMSRGDLTLSIEPAPNCLSLAYRGLTDIPREVVTGLASVEILDLSHNKISYPANAPYTYNCHNIRCFTGNHDCAKMQSVIYYAKGNFCHVRLQL